VLARQCVSRLLHEVLPTVSFALTHPRDGIGGPLPPGGVTCRIAPPRSRLQRKRHGPNFGRTTSPHRLLMRRTRIWIGFGNRKDGDHRCLARQCMRRGPCRRQPRSRSSNACCKQCDGAAWSHGSSDFRAAISLAWLTYPGYLVERSSRAARRCSRAMFQTNRQQSATRSAYSACEAVNSNR
jgi:hypothetical protein